MMGGLLVVAVVAITAVVVLAVRSRRSIEHLGAAEGRVAGAADVVIDIRDGAEPSSVEDVIPSYDSLKATDVVDALRHLDPDRLDLVRRHELDHKARKTVLAKIDSLRGA